MEKRDDDPPLLPPFLLCSRSPVSARRAATKAGTERTSCKAGRGTTRHTLGAQACRATRARKMDTQLPASGLEMGFYCVVSQFPRTIMLLWYMFEVQQSHNHRSVMFLIECNAGAAALATRSCLEQPWRHFRYPWSRRPLDAKSCPPRS